MTGRPISSANKENDIRRRLGFPAEAQLIFYPDPKDEESKTDIISWEIEEEKGSYTVVSVVTSEKTYRLCSGIVAFMQDPAFIERNNK